MKIRECEVHGIERIEGKRKSDGQAYGFWKLHLLIPFSAKANASGFKCGTCTLTDEEYDEESPVLGCTVTIVTAGYDRYEFVMVDGDAYN